MLGVDFAAVAGVVGGGDGVVFGVGGGALNRLSAEPFYRTVFTLGPQGESFAFDFIVYAAWIHLGGNDAVCDRNAFNIFAFDVGGGCHAGLVVVFRPYAVIRAIPGNDDSSRQVDGRCLVSIFSLAAATSVTVSALASVRLTGCPQNHFTEPFSRLPHRESLLPWISLFTPLGFILAVTTPFLTSTSLTYLPLMSVGEDATPAEALFSGHSP